MIHDYRIQTLGSKQNLIVNKIENNKLDAIFIANEFNINDIILLTLSVGNNELDSEWIITDIVSVEKDQKRNVTSYHCVLELKK